jgi:hypothetical protein
MPPLRKPFCLAVQVTQAVMWLAAQGMSQCRLRLRARLALAAEHLFFHKQVALYQARAAPSQHQMNATRLTLVWLSYGFDWPPALTIVRPATFKRWRRQGWRLVWKMPSRPGRPPIPPELQVLIRRMARENLTWGQQRMANELLLKLGLRVSPRTVRQYMPRDGVGGPGQRGQSQRWSTCIRNHAKGLIVSGVGAEIARGMPVVFAHMIRLVQWWRKRRHRPALSAAAPRHGAVVARLGSPRALGNVTPLHRAAGMRGVKRGPPARGPSRQQHPVPVAHALPGERSDVRVVPAESCWRSFTSPPVRGVQAAISGAIRSAPLPSAA